LDNSDIKILSRLLNNCRESDRQIGKELGISGGSVRARIRKMVDAQIIENFTIKVEPPVFGLGVLYIVVSGQNIKEILEQISLVGKPFFIVPCVGGVTVCGIVAKGNLEEKIKLANKLMKDVRVLSIFEAENPGFNANLTKTDLDILEQLMKDPQQKIESISQKTKFSTKTVTRCIEKLNENEGIQFTLTYDPTKIKGFIHMQYLLGLKETLRELWKEWSKIFQIHFYKFHLSQKIKLYYLCTVKIFTKWMS
jgi:DNA-binding Lrp family transcriptional regulator